MIAPIDKIIANMKRQFANNSHDLRVGKLPFHIRCIQETIVRAIKA